MSRTTNKFSPEVRERNVRLVLDTEGQHVSRFQAVVPIAAKFGLSAHTLNDWVKKAEVDSAKHAGILTELAERMKAQERENLELRQANELLQRASAYFGNREGVAKPASSKSSQQDESPGFNLPGSCKCWVHVCVADEPASEGQTMIRSQSDTLEQLLSEIWDRFHPAILWWADRAAATDPQNVRLVYRELLSGRRGAMDYAVRLRPFLPAQIERRRCLSWNRYALTPPPRRRSSRRASATPCCRPRCDVADWRHDDPASHTCALICPPCRG